MPKELTTRQWDTITALLTNHSVAEAAKSAGVGTRSVYRWLEQPEFKKALRQARQEQFATINRSLLSMTKTAINTMNDLMTNQTVSESVRYRVARTVLEGFYNFLQPSDLEERIFLLEENNNVPLEEEDSDVQEPPQ
jgi:hypothetical protein